MKMETLSEYENLLKLGLEHYENQELDKAIEYFTEVLKIKPDDCETLSMRANAYHIRARVKNINKDYDKAIVDCTEALKIKPDDLIIINNRGNVYEDMGEYDKAIADWESTLKLFSDNDLTVYTNKKIEIAREKMAFVKENEENIRILLGCSLAEAKAKPDYHKIMYKKGLDFAEAGDYIQALNCYELALEIKPDYYEALCYRGLAYAMLHEYENYLANLEEMLKLKPGNTEIIEMIEETQRRLYG